MEWWGPVSVLVVSVAIAAAAILLWRRRPRPFGWDFESSLDAAGRLTLRTAAGAFTVDGGRGVLVVRREEGVREIPFEDLTHVRFCYRREDEAGLAGYRGCVGWFLVPGFEDYRVALRLRDGSEIPVYASSQPRFRWIGEGGETGMAVRPGGPAEERARRVVEELRSALRAAGKELHLA